MNAAELKKIFDQTSGDFFNLLLECSPVHIFVKDENLKIVYLSKNFENLVGRPISEMIGKYTDEIFPSVIADRMIADDKKAMAAGKSLPIDEEVNGRFYTTTKFPIYKNGKPIFLAGFSIDITDKKIAAEDAVLSQMRLESLVNIFKSKVESVQQFLDFALSEAIKLTASKIGYIYYYDETKQEFTLNTWSKDVMLQCQINEPKTTYHLEKTGIWGEAVRQRKAIIVNDFIAPNPLKKGYPSGHADLGRFLTIPIFDDGKIVAVVGVANKQTDYNQTDILQLTILMHSVWKQTDKMQANETIDMLKRSIEVLSESAYWIDTNNCFVYINQAGCASLGYTKEELIGKHISLVNVHASQTNMTKVWEILQNKNFYIRESIHKRKNGTEFPVEIRSNHVEFAGKKYICGFAIDITEKKRAEEAMINSQKLESLGILAGGIAHDFNNLLGGIFGYIDMAIETSTNEKNRHYLSKAISAIDRARGLTQQLLTFAKGGAPVQQVGQLFPLIQDVAQFSLSGSNVACHFEIAENLPPCSFDPSQIGQVIDNMVINAKQAMQNGGHIEIKAENIILKSNEHYTLPAGSFIKISIRDFGIGISREDLTHIFDPFFTTKASGHGLGLATCYSIINRHGGCIDVISEIGKGSTFTIYLPTTSDHVSIATGLPDQTFSGTGTFIIMDDEEVLREIIGDMLQSLGFSISAVGNGKDALSQFSTFLSTHQKIAGMIFDLTIPGGMGGKETIVEVRKISQDVPVFVSSGYAEDPVMANPKEYGFTASICKPFKKSDLMQMLKQYMPK